MNRDIYVVGLREATLLLVEGNSIKLVGKRPIRLFKFGQEPKEFISDMDINYLLK